LAFKFFVIPVRDSHAAEAELNAFLGRHKVLSVDRRWVEQGTDSFWSVCVDHLTGGSSSAPVGGPPRGKVDYKEVLKPEDFAVFAKLREWRKDVAKQEAVPVYTIFTNEQLAQIVEKRVATKSDLEKITGVGDSRVERYGARVLELLGLLQHGEHEASGKSV
jgi:superfamily II DNA helicase RecQ